MVGHLDKIDLSSSNRRCEVLTARIASASFGVEVVEAQAKGDLAREGGRGGKEGEVVDRERKV